MTSIVLFTFWPSLLQPLFLTTGFSLSFTDLCTLLLHVYILTWLMFNAVKSTCKACEPCYEWPWLRSDHAFLRDVGNSITRFNKECSIHHEITLWSPIPWLPHTLRCIIPLSHLKHPKMSNIIKFIQPIHFFFWYQWATNSLLMCDKYRIKYVKRMSIFFFFF